MTGADWYVTGFDKSVLKLANSSTSNNASPKHGLNGKYYQEWAVPVFKCGMANCLPVSFPSTSHGWLRCEMCRCTKCLSHFSDGVTSEYEEGCSLPGKAQ